MTALLREWILGIVAVSLLSACAQTLAGAASAKRVIGLISAFALFLTVALPLQRVDMAVFRTSFAQYERAYARSAQDAAAASEQLLCELAKESLAEYVTGLASARHIPCSVRVEVAQTGDGPLPSACTLTPEREISSAEAEALRAEIIAALGTENVSVRGR